MFESSALPLRVHTTANCCCYNVQWYMVNVLRILKLTKDFETRHMMGSICGFLTLMLLAPSFTHFSNIVTYAAFIDK